MTQVFAQGASGLAGCRPLALPADAVACANEMLLRGDARRLWDFEEHLDDPARDWRNLGLGAAAAAAAEAGSE